MLKNRLVVDGRVTKRVFAAMSRLVRRAHSFYKRVERHLEAIHVFITTYNLAIKQATMT